jgi:hypothetical protein
MAPSQSHDTLQWHSLPAKLISSPGFIVVFKKDVSQDTIDRQADDVNQNGGSVKNKFDFVLRVRSAVLDLRTYHL